MDVSEKPQEECYKWELEWFMPKDNCYYSFDKCVICVEAGVITQKNVRVLLKRLIPYKIVPKSQHWASPDPEILI